MDLTRKRATLLFLLLVGVAAISGVACAESLTGFVVGRDPDDVSHWMERGEHGLFWLRFALAFAVAACLAALGALISCGFSLRRPLVRRAVLLLVLGLIGGYGAALHLRSWALRIGSGASWSLRSRVSPEVRAMNRVTWVPLFGGGVALVAGLILWPFSRRKPIRPGTRLVSRAAVRVRVVGFSDPFDEGVEATLPAGEIVRVHCKAPKGFDGYWLVPQRRERLEDRLVPRHMRRRPDYDGYALFVGYEDLRRCFRRVREPRAPP